MRGGGEIAGSLSKSKAVHMEPKYTLYLCLARSQQQVWSRKLPPKLRNRLLWTGDEFLETVFMNICANIYISYLQTFSTLR
jgi:hypothetical protein